jgi:hypothetical protein
MLRRCPQATLLLRDLAIGLLVLLLACALIRQALWSGGLADRSIIDVKTEVAADYKPDVVFVGTSHFALGLHPATFDAAMAARGIITRSFDLTFSGLSVAEIGPALQAFFKHQPCCVKYIVLEAAFMQTDIGWHLPNNVRTIVYFNISNAIDFLDLTFAYSQLPSHQGRWDYVRNVVQSTIIHYSNLGLAEALLNAAHPLENFRETEWGSGDSADGEPSSGGIRDAFVTERAALFNVKPKYLAHQLPPPWIPGTFVNDKMLDYFIDLARTIERQDVGVIVVQPPMTSDWQYVTDFVDGFRRRCGDARLIDFSDPAENEALYQNVSFWNDGGHLSKSGARVWSKMLAERIAKIVQEDTAAGKRQPACPG